MYANDWHNRPRPLLRLPTVTSPKERFKYVNTADQSTPVKVPYNHQLPKNNAKPPDSQHANATLPRQPQRNQQYAANSGNNTSDVVGRHHSASQYASKTKIPERHLHPPSTYDSTLQTSTNTQSGSNVWSISTIVVQATDKGIKLHATSATNGFPPRHTVHTHPSNPNQNTRFVNRSVKLFTCPSSSPTPHWHKGYRWGENVISVSGYEYQSR